MRQSCAEKCDKRGRRVKRREREEKRGARARAARGRVVGQRRRPCARASRAPFFLSDLQWLPTDTRRSKGRRAAHRGAGQNRGATNGRGGGGGRLAPRAGAGGDKRARGGVARPFPLWLRPSDFLVFKW